MRRETARRDYITKRYVCARTRFPRDAGAIFLLFRQLISRSSLLALVSRFSLRLFQVVLVVPISSLCLALLKLIAPLNVMPLLNTYLVYSLRFSFTVLITGGLLSL